MLVCKYYTKNYKHDYFFDFQGKKYRVHSIVYLTADGQRYLGAWRRKAILTEQFTDCSGKLCWKYQFKSNKLSVGIVDYATDRPPDELIEKIVMEANSEYVEREIFGAEVSSCKPVKKQKKKDWEIPEVRRGWIVFIIIFFAAMVFKDWYIQLIIRMAAGWIFGMYRKAYMDAYTTYIYDENTEMLTQKYEVLYGTKEDNKK